AYLNIERSVLDLERPTTFLLEAARQLASQIPSLRPKFLKLKENIEEDLLTYDLFEVSKSYHSSSLAEGSSSFAAKLFGEIVSSIKTPVLLIVDTFEEAQSLGTEVVEEVWRILVSMQQVAPNLRIVVAGRAIVEEFPIHKLMLR